VRVPAPARGVPVLVQVVAGKKQTTYLAKWLTFTPSPVNSGPDSCKAVIDSLELAYIILITKKMVSDLGSIYAWTLMEAAY
jgi:hypothetical protein